MTEYTQTRITKNHLEKLRLLSQRERRSMMAQLGLMIDRDYDKADRLPETLPNKRLIKLADSPDVNPESEAEKPEPKEKQ